MNRWRYQFTASVLHAGGVIAYPTEAVWGLGCDPLNEDAVLRLLELKQRPVDKGVILVAADIEQVQPYLGSITVAQRLQLEQTWPGFQTWTVPASNFVPDWIKGRHSSVAIRVSAHPSIQALCRYFGGPIVSTSANHAGRAAANNRYKLAAYFDKQLDDVLPGALGGARKPSPIRDLSSGSLIRQS